MDDESGLSGDDDRDELTSDNVIEEKEAYTPTICFDETFVECCLLGRRRRLQRGKMAENINSGVRNCM